MRYERILLVNPPYTGSRVRTVFCAGLGYIAESLKSSGFAYAVLDMSIGYTYKDLKSKIEKFHPHVIGISMMTYRYKNTYELIKHIKKDHPDIPVVAGGPHVSLFREKVLEDCPQIDYGVVMEGEQTLVNLCERGLPDTIPGLMFHKEGNVVCNGDPPLIKELDDLPFPEYERFELEKSINKEINALPIVSSRGCPFDCVYCPVQCSIGGIFRARSPENIMQEIMYWYEKGFRRFSFDDDNFMLLNRKVSNERYEAEL
jgi:radical SAM superfamily enzyme YgiQ (UPF0313 family)